MKHYDAAVVGCGAMGSSLSYNLASRGMKVLTLERFNLNHPFGSSHSKTRIIRTSYYEDPRYVPLLRRAFQSWEELQAKSEKRIITLTGGLMVGSMTGELVSGALRSAREHSLQHSLLSSSELKERFGVFSFDDDQSGVYEHGAGILYPEDCIESYAGLSARAGADLRFEEALTRWRTEKEGIELVTEKDTYRADKVVFAAGPWTTKLLDGVVPLNCERQVPFWFSPGEEDGYSPKNMPIFMVEERDKRLFYGVPDVGHGVKVARHHGGDLVDPEKVDRNVTETDSLPVTDFVKLRLWGLNPQPVNSATCLYTNTPDGNFVIDFHPQDERLVIVSACSGHGFKFASVIGEIGADLIATGATRHDISFLGLGRFVSPV